jgi:predicted Zn-dependent protease
VRRLLISLLIIIFCTNNSIAETQTVKLKVTKSQEQEVRRIYDFFIESLGKETKDYKFEIKESEVLNAYATLGKKIMVTTGLINKLESESALALVIAHELGHVERKHVIQGISRGVLGTALGVVLAIFGNNQTASGAYNGLNYASGKAFSRSKERSADLFAIHLVNKYYCDVPNKLEFFHEISKKRSGNLYQKYFSSHPLTAERIEYLELLIKDEGCVL